LRKNLTLTQTPKPVRTGLKNLELRELVGRPFPLELFTRPGLRTKQVREQRLGQDNAVDGFA